MPIKEIISRSKKNQVRLAHLIAAISEKINYKTEGVTCIVLSEQDSRELMQLYEQVKFAVAQQENLLGRLIEMHASALANYRDCVADEKATDAEKLGMLERLLALALEWVGDDVREYLELRRKTILESVVKMER
jgi:hypothetical protein